MSKIDKVISKISESSEFKNIIDNISSNLNKLDNSDVQSSNPLNIEYSDNLLEEKLGMFLLDKDGNNICDCINSLNQTLKTIIDTKK